MKKVIDMEYIRTIVSVKADGLHGINKYTVSEAYDN